jgi:hypothetical protein
MIAIATSISTKVNARGAAGMAETVCGRLWQRRSSRAIAEILRAA